MTRRLVLYFSLALLIFALVIGGSVFTLSAGYVRCYRPIGRMVKTLRTASDSPDVQERTELEVLLQFCEESYEGTRGDAYGLTQNRVIASWFMLLLALVFAVLLLKQCIRNIPAAVIIAAGGTAMLAGLCFARPDARIAEYNIARYEAGTLDQLDAASLCALSEDAYTVMLRHPETLDAAGQLDEVLRCAQEREQEIRTLNGRSSNLPAQLLLQQLHTDTGHGLLLRRAS